ncbi:RNA recognition motif domain-containing protein [Elusimicrobiota bacterium]
MNKILFVGSFPYETTQEELSELFGKFGKIVSVKILVERATGRSRGMGFVEMSTDAEAQAAIAKLNGSILGLRKIFVSEARPEEKKLGAPADNPDFVERRSGKDRRKAQGAPRGGDSGPSGRPTTGKGRPERPFGEKKKWAGKPGSPGKKDWKKRPAFSRGPKSPWSREPGTGGDSRKGRGGKKKWGSKPWEAQPEGRFGKKRGGKPGGFGPKKPGGKPGGFGPRKPGGRPGGSGPRKPGGFGPRKPGGRPGGSGPRKPGGRPGGSGPRKPGGRPGGSGPRKPGRKP